jgi:hypothetical protein
MKRLSWIAGIAALLFGALSLAPGIASAQGWRGGTTVRGGGYHAAPAGGGRRRVAVAADELGLGCAPLAVERRDLGVGAGIFGAAVLSRETQSRGVRQGPRPSLE